MEKQCIKQTPMYLLDAEVNPRSLGTLQELKQKENTMYHDQDTSAYISGPRPRANVTKASATQANIDLQVNMPAAKDPADRAREHLLGRASAASFEKRSEMSKAFGLIDDERPRTLKDFFARIKDGMYVISTDETELNRERWSLEDLLDEVTWRDPARKEDQDGFDAANKLMSQALNDVSDEIIVKTPDQGLEALRAFQAKTFN